MRAWSSLLKTVVATCFASQAAAVTYGGVNIAGFDFGVDTSGSWSGYPTVSVASTGQAQMSSFVAAGMNAFRLPVAWQYLANGTPGSLNQANFATYNGLVQGCLNSGAALCIVDLHNYARWNGQIIGQGGPAIADYASFWGQLAAKFGNNTRVAFDTMNEPHDLDIGTWASTLQQVVTAIRNAGAKNNKIFISGTSYASLGAFATQSGPQLLGIKNPDGTTNNIIFSVHQYLDSNFSGTSDECSQDVTGSVEALASWLRSNGRQAIVLETGGGNTQSCVQFVCQELSVINENQDVFMGVTVWAAGAFDSSYALIQSTSDLLFTSCVAPQLGSAHRRH